MVLGWDIGGVHTKVAMVASGQIVGDLDAAAKAKDDPKLIAAQTALGRTCTSCHAAHRQSMGAGVFEIK